MFSTKRLLVCILGVLVFAVGSTIVAASLGIMPRIPEWYGLGAGATIALIGAGIIFATIDGAPSRQTHKWHSSHTHTFSQNSTGRVYILLRTEGVPATFSVTLAWSDAGHIWRRDPQEIVVSRSGTRLYIGETAHGFTVRVTAHGPHEVTARCSLDRPKAGTEYDCTDGWVG